MKGLLHILSGDSENGVIDLETGTYAIGRDEKVEIRINSRQVSRKHAQLIVDKNSIRIVDNGSSNGTEVNGKSITAVELKDGDRIQVGDVLFEYRPKRVRSNRPAAKNEKDLFTIKRQPMPIGQYSETALRRSPIGLQKTLPLRLTLSVVFSAVFALAAFGAGTMYRSMLKNRLGAESLRHANNLVRYLAEKNREDLRLGNELLLDVNSVAKEKGVREALIINAKGRIVAPVSRLSQIDNDPFTIEALSQQNDRDILPSPRLRDGTIILAHPIRSYDAKLGSYFTVGVAKIIFSSDDAVGALPEANRIIGLMVICAIGLALGVSWIFSRIFTTPLHHLAESIQQWRTGQSRSLSTSPFQEWASLYRAVDEAIEEKDR